MIKIVCVRLFWFMFFKENCRYKTNWYLFTHRVWVVRADIVASWYALSIEEIRPSRTFCTGWCFYCLHSTWRFVTTSSLFLHKLRSSKYSIIFLRRHTTYTYFAIKRSKLICNTHCFKFELNVRFHSYNNHCTYITQHIVCIYYIFIYIYIIFFFVECKYF